MSQGTHAQRIIELLAARPGLDDDEISRALGIEPRQTVNQICRRLADNGMLRRERGPTGKIVNIATGTRSSASSPPKPAARPERLGEGPGSCALPYVSQEFSKTLLIIPCSGAKRNVSAPAEAGPAITESLPPDLAAALIAARSRLHAKIPLDEATLVPAWQRYDGALYAAGREALGALMAQGCHVIILSGGYGAVLAAEPIGNYEARLSPGWWPDRIIQRVLLAYAQRHELASVRAVVSATGPYVDILKRVRWREAGIEDALTLTPEPEPGGMKRSPATQGEALEALASRTLSPDWRSSYGLGLISRRS